MLIWTIKYESSNMKMIMMITQSNFSKSHKNQISAIHSIHWLFFKSHWCMHNVFLFIDVLCWKLLLHNSSIESNVFTIQSWICQSIFVLTLLCFCLILFLCFTLHYFTLHCWTMLLSVFFLWFLLWSFSQFLYLNFFVSCWYSFEYLSFSFSLSKIDFSLFLCWKTYTPTHIHITFTYFYKLTRTHMNSQWIQRIYTLC